MNKSILILEENSVIHGLVASALDIDGLTLHHEFNPENYVERVISLLPDLILISNKDQQSDYAVCRKIKGNDPSANIPLLLMVNSMEIVDKGIIKDLQVGGVIRKPFEASDLQQQVSRHLDMIDLIGTAFEYKKAQSMEEGTDPLANLEVIDSEVLNLLQESEAGKVPEKEVPRVDFETDLDDGTAEIMLDEEIMVETLQPDGVFEAIEEEPEGMESIITTPETEGETDGLTGEIDLSDQEGQDIGELEVELDSDAVLEEEPPGETAMMEVDSAEIQVEEETELEELGAADILDEETPEEEALEPSGIDQPLESEETPLQTETEESSLDEIVVEIAEEDVDFAGVDQAMTEGGVDIFEEEPDEQESISQEDDDDTDIPPAVRRMMDLKPIFTLSTEKDKDFAEFDGDKSPSLLSGDEELEKITEELAPLDEINLQEESIFGDEETPPLEADQTAQAEKDEGEDPEGEGMEFDEEFLGDDEIDEDRILAAMEEGEAQEKQELEELEDFEISEMDESELEELEALSEIEADKSLPEVDEEPFDEELMLDQDEEAMMMAALEEDESFEQSFEAVGKEPASTEEEDSVPGVVLEPLDDEMPEAGTDQSEEDLQALEEETVSELGELEENLTKVEEPLETLESTDSLTDLPPLDEAMETSGLESEEFESGGELDLGDNLVTEIPPMAMEEETPVEPNLVDAMEADKDSASLDEIEEEIALNGPEEDSLEIDELVEDEQEEELMLDGDLEGLPDELIEEGTEEELDVASGEEEEMPTELVQEESGLQPEASVEMETWGADKATEEEPGETGDDFMSELSELKAEIAANPVGERLSDILGVEDIEESVDDLEMELPAEEDSFNRAMGVSEIPEGEALDMKTPETIPGESSAGQIMEGLKDTIIDPEVKARLGDVLDEIIITSVRKAVREEMPKIMERLNKEDRQA